MSDEQLISIEENGDYWLSKSNTAYHIINPKASDLIYIDEIGNFSLGKSGDQHYILDANGNSIRFDGPTYAPGYSFTDTPLHVEESFTNEGFQNDYPDGNFWVLFQREEWANKGGVSNYGYMARKYDASGVSKGTDFVKTGNHVELRPYMEYEAMFGVDLNNDKIIPTGINPNNLMDISGNQHHIDDGHVSDGIILKIDNTTIDPNSNGGLNATQVQKNGDYYEVLLEHENVKYDVWKVNSEGNFVSSIKAKLWQDEKKFGVDINLDGDTGLQPVEEIGSVHLKLGDNTYNGAPQYYIVDGIKDPIGLTHGGAATRSTSYAGWSATQVIASGDGGYEVLWSHTGGKYEVWKVSSEGNFLSYNKAKLWEDEKKFNFDINLDGDTGLQPVEEIGSVHLKLGDNTYNGAPQYYIVDGIKDPIGLTHGGAATRSTSYAGWSATQVIASGDGGYEVLWSHTGGKYEVWKVNSEGNFLSYNKAKLWQDELKFGVDLNGDSDTGLVTVEDNGGVLLKHDDNSYFIVKGSNDPVGLTSGGASKGPTSFPGWSATQVEASASGGYEVFWSHSSGKTTAWKVDALGSYQSHISVTKSVTESGITIIKYDDHSWKFGGNGNDSLSGSIGNDTIDGGDGNDHINGYSGHDTLMGGDGNDGLRGSHGNDQIDGGTGSDTITTGSGLDKIILRIGDGGNTLSNADIITDFTDGSDNFGLDGGLLFSQLVIAQGSDAYASDTIISAGSEYLAILQGIDASLLSDADFETVDIA
jgi:Ca2+-binding RTX toxin-like protein